VEGAYIVPTPAAQARLMQMLASDASALRLHQRPYSLVSTVWGKKYQQSNQWAIETPPAAMMSGVSDRARAQAWLSWNGYRPTVLNIGPLTRLGARDTAVDVAFDDHPSNLRYSDHIVTVTVDSVFEWMERARLAGHPVEVR
jgi:hypothetical protein